MSTILNVAFAGASIVSLAFTGGSVLELAFLASCVVISVKTYFSDQVKVRDTSQLIKDISKVLQELVKCFNGTTMSRFCFSLCIILLSVFAAFWLTFDGFPEILLSYLKDSEFVIGFAL